MVEEWGTPRLLLRPPEPDDGEGYQRLFLDPAVSEWLRPAPMKPFDDGEVLGMLDEDRGHWARHGFGPWVLVEREDGAMVGRGGLRWTEIDDRLTVELPWAVRSDRWGHGLASEAAAAAVEWAGTLSLTDVAALVLPGNLRSRRVAEKAGLRLAGDTLHAGIPHLLYRLGPEEAEPTDPG